MLNWIWFVILVTGSIAVTLRAAYVMDKCSDDERYDSLAISSALVCVGLLLFALLCISNELIVPAYQWLAASLPAPDTALNTITAFVLTLIPSLCFVVGVPSAVTVAFDWERARHDRGPASVERDNVIGIESRKVRRASHES